jgi:hypothetical protein
MVIRINCVYFANLNDVTSLQGAAGGIERDVYEKLIGPYRRDLPSKTEEGFKRACTRHRYAFMTSNHFTRVKPCHLVALPETSYPETLTYIISKNSPYKGLINWK